MSLLLVCADARRIPLPDDSVQCVVTSPPYWGLRKYAGEQERVWLPWEPTAGETVTCGHNWGPMNFCVRCRAWRGAYGLEPTIEMYVAHTIEILHEIRRVLRPDGVVFWNVGDSYANDAKWGGSTGGKHVAALHGDTGVGRQKRNTGLKPKDLVLMPSRVALAAQADGWWVRSMIVWAKPNPMPESVTDRPTDSYEHIVMLTKSERYWWDAEAVREPSTDGNWKRSNFTYERDLVIHPTTGKANTHVERSGRNLRNVWTFATQPYSGAHFATFPEELPRRCIKAASKAGDLVLDPFGGSGTTGRVAIQLGRSAVLLDLAYAHEYGPLALRRTNEVQQELML